MLAFNSNKISCRNPFPIKIYYVQAIVKLIYELMTKPQLRIDTVVKKNEKTIIKYHVQFTIVNKRQPFSHNVSFLMDHIGQFNFNKRDMALISFLNQYQNLENTRINK